MIYRAVLSIQRFFTEEQGWRSGESARLPLMWPGFESWRRRHMWVEFVVGSLLCSERFFSGYSGFPLSLKTNTSKFQLFSDPWVNKLQFTIYNIFLKIFLHSDRILRSCWQKLTAHYAFRNLDLNLKLNSVMEYACPGN